MLSPTIESYRRVRGTVFAASFYEKFLATDPEVRRLFAKTDFERQRDLFQHGVLMLLEYAHESPVGKLALERLATLHDTSHIGVPPRLYEPWVRCLLTTLAETDPSWTPALEHAWRADLAPGVALMTRTFERSSRR